MEKTSKIRVDFHYQESPYYAILAVTREPNGMRYHMKAEVFNAKDKKIFEKQRSGLDYTQVEYALTFVFHQAFVEA